MDTQQLRETLRSAVSAGDGPVLVATLTTMGWPEHVLQVVGDGLREAVERRVEGAEQLAHRCVSRLRERDWEGDEDLAEAIEGALGLGAPSPLQPLPVDLDDVGDILGSNPVEGGGRIDLRTGEVWHESPFDDAFDDDDDEDEDGNPDDTLWVEGRGSRAAYRDMEVFIDTVADPVMADRLSIAIDGPGAFRRFRSVISRDDGVAAQWRAFSDERTRGRARAWLAAEGIAPVREAPATP
ncbi:conserved hypothetical protein [Nostocoides japonicum T1-X7]|uniref:Uncharacterized protein n=1 Tax=Nostocoides japonicum T1-X7 TaxID=1194083 RepID=A0A077LW40_9MICO|nr:UPF0158 family protein [Tetrasphaera japonica]CCH77037.1 conserved hypothetical protein [Tetrasphaera japonica T1-X7]